MRLLDEEDGMSEDEMVELPGGIDQLESIIEDHNKPEDNSKLIFSKHEKSGMQSWAGAHGSVSRFVVELCWIFMIVWKYT